MGIVEALGAASTAIQVAKDIKGLSDSINSADLKMKIAELTSELATAKLALVDVQDQMAAKDREIDRLRSAFEFKAELVKADGFYWHAPEGAPKGQPYCPRCMEIDGRAAELVRTNPPVGFGKKCPVCDRTYEVRGR